MMLCGSKPGTYIAPSLAHFRAAIREAEARGAEVDAPNPKLVDWLESTGPRGDPLNWKTIGSDLLRSSIDLHQVKAVNRVVEELGGRAFVALPPGTGKTLTSVTIAAHYGLPILAIVPTSAQGQWKEEFGMWTDFSPCTFVKGARKEDEDPLGDVVVTTYTSVQMRPDDVGKRKWKTVIIDESQSLGGDCDTNAAIVKICERAQCVLAVSGTVMNGRPRELFNVFRSLMPKIFTNRKVFEKRYCEAKIGRFGYENRGAAHVDELETVFNYMMVTCSKEEVLKNLPPITYTDVRFDMSDDDKTEFADMERKYKELGKKAESAPMELAVKLKSAMDALSGKMRMRTGQAKLPQAVEWILNLLSNRDPTEKVLVFCHYISLLDEVCTALKDRNIGYARIDGKVPTHKRFEAIKAIKNPNDPSARVGVLSLGTGATALNLAPGANIVVLLEMSFTPSDHEQACARSWRRGAKRPVEVYRMIANSSYDDVILRIHASKERTADQIFKKLRVAE